MRNKLKLIKFFFITSLIISNVVTGKIVNIFGLIVPGAAICYAFTFLATDIVSEIEGKEAAHELVIFGFFSALFAALLILLTQYLPSASFALEKGKAYDILLGFNFRIVFASMVAYFTSQWIDVNIFHFFKKLTNSNHKWLRNTASTSISQIVDTAIFITIAFYDQVPNILFMIFSQYLLKLVIAIADTPVFYLLTKSNIITNEK